MNCEYRHCVCLAGSRSSSPQRSAGNRLVQCPPDVAAVQRPGSSLGMRSKAPQTHRVAQSQGNSREASPDRQRFGFGGTNSVIHRQSELEAAVADALVSCRTVVNSNDFCEKYHKLLALVVIDSEGDSIVRVCVII